MNAPSQALESTPYWTAICARDARKDGSFVFAVKTTGVYCKPSCAARRPLPKNVEIFDGPAAAELRGYRACKRCKPGQTHESWITRACAHLSQNVDRRVPLSELAETVGLSPFHVQRAFKEALGVSPRAYAESLRTRSLKTELTRAKNVTRAVFDAGFEPSRVPDLGMTPRDYRAGGEGLEVRYAIAKSVLGPLLVAVTARGVCSIQLGDALPQKLRDELPRAKLVRDDRGLGETVAAVLSLLDGGSPALPLDIRATAFQRRVYEALQKIPAGTTITYTELAEAIGAKGAVRAVARACATNPVALLIPCHRVIRRGGELAGYRWGLDRKRALLEREKRQRQSMV